MTSTQITRDLIVALVSSFCEKKGDITCLINEHHGKAEFVLRVNAEDHRKVVGKQGSHIKALSYLVAELEAAHDAVYRLTLREPFPGPESTFTPVKAVTSYDPTEAKNLLALFLNQLIGHGDYTLEVKKLPPMREYPAAFCFQIRPRSLEDYDDLITPAIDDPGAQTTIGALGTIFRAFANSEGAFFKVEAVKPC